MCHKTREMSVLQRTQLLNALRGHLTEHGRSTEVGFIAARGPRHAGGLAERVEACDKTIPFEVCEALHVDIRVRAAAAAGQIPKCRPFEGPRRFGCETAGPLPAEAPYAR
jgi:hypothetical protein